MIPTLDPAAAVAASICLIARQVTVSGPPRTARHPARGCDWCAWPTPELAALLEAFDPEGPEARTFRGLTPSRQREMVAAAQAIPEAPPAAPPAPPAEPGWFDLPTEGATA